MAAKNPKYNFRNSRVTIITDDTCETYKIVDVYDNTVEHEMGVLNLSDAQKYYDVTNGGLHLFYNLDVPSKVESSNLKVLRRSQALKNIFQYEKENKLDVMAFIPYIIIILMVLFM